MKFITIFIALALLVAGPALSQSGDLGSILKPGASVRKLSGDFSFTEGPAPDQGAMYILPISRMTGL